MFDLTCSWLLSSDFFFFRACLLCAVGQVLWFERFERKEENKEGKLLTLAL